MSHHYHYHEDNYWSRYLISTLHSQQIRVYSDNINIYSDAGGCSIKRYLAIKSKKFVET